GDPALRPLELRRGDSRSDTLLRLLAGAVGEADDRERRHAALQMRLDLDAARLEADESMRDGACEHVATLGDEGKRERDACVPRVELLAPNGAFFRGSAPARPPGSAPTPPHRRRTGGSSVARLDPRRTRRGGSTSARV